MKFLHEKLLDLIKTINPRNQVFQRAEIKNKKKEAQ